MADQHSLHFSRDGIVFEPMPRAKGNHSTDTFMNTATKYTTPAFPTLLERASSPDCDPCDLAEDAMPAMICGDLTPPEETWVENHVAHCGYCARVLASFSECSSRLDSVIDAPSTRAVPPPAPAALLGLHEGRYGFMETPVGPVLIVVTDRGVAEISYLAHRSAQDAMREIEQRGILAHERQAAVGEVIDQLSQYFDGRLRVFHVPVDLYGISDFTKQVLAATNEVPYGVYRTYGQIATAIGRAGASRAVGNALGRNPVPVIVPCHRIIRSDGSMGWYTGGAGIKRTLLDIEGVSLGQQASSGQARLAL
ncbi:MAG TPA: methylated-DNA--[protein]-cysteine S-methyltransferase [Thermomicrobiales bacterium]|nr:methylated-DNA--[protein]-cysteine S-methyltransferase [Thermomicrobiales bacterium]